MAPPLSSSFSVRVVLPAAGWEIMANVRRRAASCAITAMNSSSTSVKDGQYTRAMTAPGTATIQHASSCSLGRDVVPRPRPRYQADTGLYESNGWQCEPHPPASVEKLTLRLLLTNSAIKQGQAARAAAPVVARPGWD